MSFSQWISGTSTIIYRPPESHTHVRDIFPIAKDPPPEVKKEEKKEVSTDKKKEDTKVLHSGN